MWPFSKNKELSERRQRVLCMMDEWEKKDKQIAQVQVFINPIIDRALVIRENYLQCSNETGDFRVSEIEMGHIRQFMNLIFDTEYNPTMFLGMNIVMV